MVDAHRAAAARAATVGQTPAPGEALDALILNAYPKDGELLQIEAAFTALKSGMLEWLKPAAPIVLTAACAEGIGQHALFGPGGRLFRPPAAKAFLGNHPLMVFCPSLGESDVAQAFWPGYASFRAWPQVIARLEASVPPRARIGVVPCGPLQVAMSHTPPKEQGA
jgi:hypothetical protein